MPYVGNTSLLFGAAGGGGSLPSTGYEVIRMIPDDVAGYSEGEEMLNGAWTEGVNSYTITPDDDGAGNFPLWYSDRFDVSQEGALDAEPVDVGATNAHVTAFKISSAAADFPFRGCGFDETVRLDNTTGDFKIRHGLKAGDIKTGLAYDVWHTLIILSKGANLDIDFHINGVLEYTDTANGTGALTATEYILSRNQDATSQAMVGETRGLIVLDGGTAAQLLAAAEEWVAHFDSLDP